MCCDFCCDSIYFFLYIFLTHFNFLHWICVVFNRVKELANIFFWRPDSKYVYCLQAIKVYCPNNSTRTTKATRQNLNESIWLYPIEYLIYKNRQRVGHCPQAVTFAHPWNKEGDKTVLILENKKKVHLLNWHCWLGGRDLFIY